MSLNLSSPAIESVDLSPPLFSIGRVDLALLLTLVVLAGWAIVNVVLCVRNPTKRVHSELSRKRRGPCLEGFLALLLRYPRTICLLTTATLLVPTFLQLLGQASTLTADGQPFDLEITSLRAVTGVLTDRYDAFSWLATDHSRRRATSSRGTRQLSATPLPSPFSWTLSSLLSVPLPLSPTPSPPPSSGPRSPSVLKQPSRRRRLEGARSISLFYSPRGGRQGESVVGNVLTADALVQIQQIEAAIISATGEHLVAVDSVVPCLFGHLGSSSPAERSATPPDATTVRVCLSHVASAEGRRQDLQWHFSSSCGGDAASGNASCTAIRSRIWVASSADFEGWIRTLEGLGTSLVELSWYGDNWLFWCEFNLNLRLDATLVVVSFITLLALVIAALRLPIFATLSLLVVVMSLPVGLAVYTGPLQQQKLPILAIVSIYLILGIGADAIFVFTNSYCMECDRAVALKAITPLVTQSASSKTSGGSTQVTEGSSSTTSQESPPSLNRTSSTTSQDSTLVTKNTSSTTSDDSGDPRAVPPAVPQQSSREGVRLERSDSVEVLARTLRNSVSVTGLSALTTAVAFGASINSPISTIRQYAAFQTACVVANLAAIVFIFVPLMLAWRRSLTRAHSRLERLTLSFPILARVPTSMICAPFTIVLAPSTSAFWARAAVLIVRRRNLLLAAWLVVIALQLYFCSQLSPTNDAPRVFEENHNLERRVHLKRYAFAEETSSVSEGVPGADVSEATLVWLRTAQARECLQRCALDQLGDGVCQSACNSVECCSDWGDCGSCAFIDGEGSVSLPSSGDPPTPPSASAIPRIPPTPPVPPPTPPPTPDPPPIPPPSPLPPLPLQPTSTPPQLPLLVSPTLPQLPSGLPPPPPAANSNTCNPASSEELSSECLFRGLCIAPGYCSCLQGYSGTSCEQLLDADGSQLHLLPESHCAVINLVWGMHAKPSRTFIDGKPISASLDATQPLLDQKSQHLIAKLCEYLESAPPWHVRPGSLKCPIRDLQREREAEGSSWPVPENELLSLLVPMTQRDDWVQSHLALSEVNGEVALAYVMVSLKANVLAEGSAQALKSEAGWFEGLIRRHNAVAAEAGSNLRGWQTSSAWVWMEAIDEAVGGTAGCIASGALLTFSTLLLFTGSFSLALSTIGGVTVILICFVGYLTQRGYPLGVIEAIATTIFIGLACDYCVHLCQTHRNGDASLLQTLSHAGPSLYSSALTTAGSAAPLLLCRVLIFRQMGEFIIVCTTISLAVVVSLIAPAIELIEQRRRRHAPDVYQRKQGTHKSETEDVNSTTKGLQKRDEQVDHSAHELAISQGSESHTKS
ncbi:hypothetical protein AB1Y20_011215 [Prymnesium parvum]|uniref:EGF-like domain-containing protein n=1 Tax=Prymnesium parvum TaxID=97485 RepID=A0AB34INM7_PRYPA